MSAKKQKDDLVLIRLGAEIDKVRVSNLDINSQKKLKNEYDSLNPNNKPCDGNDAEDDDDDDDYKIPVYKQLVETEKIRIDSFGDWEFYVYICNVNDFESRQDLDDLASRKKLEYNQEISKVISFQEALDFFPAEISINLTYYLTHQDQLEKDLKRKIESDGIKKELIFHQYKLEKKFNEIKIEFDEREKEGKFYTKEKFIEKIDRLTLEIENIKNELSSFENNDYQDNLKVDDLENNKSLVEKELLYNHLCHLFGNESQIDNNYNYVLEDLHVLINNGDYITATSKKENYYLIFEYWSS